MSKVSNDQSFCLTQPRYLRELPSAMKAIAFAAFRAGATLPQMNAATPTDLCSDKMPWYQT